MLLDAALICWNLCGLSRGGGGGKCQENKPEGDNGPGKLVWADQASIPISGVNYQWA